MANNVENLSHGWDKTPEEWREFARVGGKASGVAAKRRRNMRELARLMLDTELLESDNLKAELEARGFDATGAGMVLWAQMHKASRGDTEAARFLRDTSGQKPAELIGIGDTREALEALDKLDMSSLTDDDLHRLIDAAEPVGAT